ncbi:hypothetical protein DF185_07365 [Marinifilum breve]|uniref:Uncharacterized protein n=1 Tax=Marinifilum breve TaxID=2184082 RepID=A0A2V4A1J9_9BACT|nr:hypothetical protein [Marinifilum breve]PXY02461.1 hypothetical protein DF185_07365 [Marinifilum breve]
MKSIIALLVFLLVALSISAQSTNEDEYLSKWQEYKEQKAPFNFEVEKEVIVLEDYMEFKRPNLGNLNYKKESFTVGQEVLGVALHLTEAIYENVRYHERIAQDPAKYFLPGYHTNTRDFMK